MKILQVCPYFYPYLAGQEMYVLQLSKKLKQYGHEVTIYTSNHSRLPRYEKIEELDVFRFKMLFNPLNNPICPEFFTIFKNLKNYDIIHVHNEHAFVTFVACLINLYFRKPITITCHGQLRFGTKLKDFLEDLYSVTVGKFIFNSVNRVIANSEEDKKYIVSLDTNASRVTVLSNAIDRKHLDNLQIQDEKAIKDIKTRYNGKKIILFVGVIIKRKGIDYLLKSIFEITKHDKDIILLVIGEGKCKRDAESLVKKLGIEEYVLFLGRVSEAELIISYNIADIFVLPSLSEVCPTVILEAMHFGLPVISTDIPGIRDHFKDFAVLVPPKDERQLERAIIDVLDNKQLRERLSKRGQALIREKYTWDRVAKEYESLYKKLILNTDKI